jgi:anti-sigma B factor antagonist
MSAPGPLNVVKSGDVTVVVFGSQHRQLAEVGLEEISNQLVEVAKSATPPLVIIDMAITEFFGSSFIEVLFRVWKQLNSQPNAKFAISGLQPYCREVLEITHLDRLWPMYATRDEAIKAIASA